MRIIATQLLILLLGSTCAAQGIYATRDSVHIFWQPGLKITFNDYKGDTTNQVMNLMRKYNFKASASVGIWSALDIPGKKRDRRTKLEKVYIAPAFERTTSFTTTSDTTELMIQNAYFDICEISARYAREELQHLQDSMKGYGITSIMYMTVRQEMNERKLQFYREYFKDVIVDKRPNAYREWRTLFDRLLNASKQWATKPEECHRLLTGQPIDIGYIQAPEVVGPLFPKEN